MRVAPSLWAFPLFCPLKASNTFKIKKSSNEKHIWEFSQAPRGWLGLCWGLFLQRLALRFKKSKFLSFIVVWCFFFFFLTTSTLTYLSIMAAYSFIRMPAPPEKKSDDPPEYIAVRCHTCGKLLNDCGNPCRYTSYYYPGDNQNDDSVEQPLESDLVYFAVVEMQTKRTVAAGPISKELVVLKMLYIVLYLNYNERLLMDLENI